MSEWKKVKLGEVANIFSGYAFKSHDMNNICGIPLIKIKNIANFIVSTNCDSYLNNNVDLKKWEKYKLQADDFLIAMTGQGSVGRVGKMISFSPFYYVNQRVAIVRPNTSIINPYFLYKCFATKERENELFNKANGAGQPNISPSQIGEIEFSIPTISSQNSIATILSRYDSLIENYQKQIKLLEEAAQRLYKEWFVDLHFPGHENTKIVDGVPEGWEKKTLDSFCNVFTGKKNANQGIPNGEYKFFTCGDTPLLINSYIYDGPAIIVSGNGSYTGRTTFYEGKFDLYQRTYACTLKDTNNNDLIYGLYELVKCELTNKISGGTHGAAIPYIVMSDLTKFDFLFNESIMHRFSSTIKSYLSLSLKLTNNIRLLTEARDRLLPKLMSGEMKSETLNQ